MSAAIQFLTPEQYLELDRGSEFRNEYYKGRMYAMLGGTFPHGVIVSNLLFGLRNSLQKRPCTVVPNDLRVRGSPQGLYTYPDVVVVCDEPRFADSRRDTVLNPTLVIEVLSPSTEAYDRGFKSAQYRTLESLQEYALVSQNEPRVEIFRRQSSGDWLFSEWTGLEAVCYFAGLDCSIRLADIYGKVIFDVEPSTF